MIVLVQFYNVIGSFTEQILEMTENQSEYIYWI